MSAGEFVSLWLLGGVIIALIAHIALDGFKDLPGSELSYILITVLLWPWVIWATIKSLARRIKESNNA